MKQTLTKLGGALFVLLFLVTSSAKAEWKDIHVDLTNKKLTQGTEADAQYNWVNGGDYIGIAVDGGGAVSRVAKNDASAVCQLKGKWHSTNYGWVNTEIIVPVEGSVKISIGNVPTYGGDVVVKNSSSITVASCNNNTGSLWNSTTNKEQVCVAYYTGDATTLTITGGNYLTYFAIEETDYVPNNKTATFSIGTSGASGIVPDAIIKDINSSNTFTIPSNFTLYKEGHTLTGWNDGSADYNIGDTYTISDDVTFTPLFMANTKTLDDRTSEVTVHWNFRTDQGVPSFSTSSGIIVGQADINGTPIDIKLDISGGTFATNQSEQWARVANVNFTVPVRKGSVFRTYQMNNTSLGTFDGVSGGTVTSNILSYNYTGDASSMVAGLNDANWYRYIEVTYPVISISPAKEFTTYCCASPLDFSNVDGLEAYVVTGSTTTTITLAQVTKVPAGTGLILKKTGSAASYNVPVGTATLLAETNKLVGVTSATSFTAGDYLLSDGKFIKGTAGTLAAGKAYLPAANVTAGAHELLLDFGGTTGIQQVESANIKIEGYYNLNGQRVAQPTKGLYIVNGKKVIMK